MKRPQDFQMMEEGLAMLSSAASIDILAERNKEILAKLNAYINEIELFNHALGLVKVASREELIIKHILDSLGPLHILAELPAFAPCQALRLGDAGSGAGLPGIPLAIALPAAHITLIERMGRRAGFLRNAQAVLALPNLEVAEMELERYPPGQFDMLCFRAFHPLDKKLLRALFKRLKPTGILAAYKGRREAIEAEMEGLTSLLGAWEAVPYQVPFLDGQRHLLLISQPGNTQLRSAPSIQR